MRAIRGRVAVVTGAGSGIGRATARAFADRGLSVALCDLDGDAAKETLSTLPGSVGTASIHQVNVASEDEMRDLVPAVLAEHGCVDIVANVAGIITAPTPTTEVPLSAFRAVMDVNFWGMVYGSLFFLPHLLERPEANLVNVSSNAGLLAYSRMAAYNSSKFAIRGFTETLRMELQSTSVRATLVCPGVTKTRLMGNSPLMSDSQRVRMQDKFERCWGRPPEGVAKAIVKAIEKDRPRTIIGPDTAALDAIVRLLPGAYSRLLAKVVERYEDSYDKR